MFEGMSEINKTGWCGTFLENHDMPRVTSRLIKNKEERTPVAAKCLGMLYMFMKGTPFIYEGQELGCLNNERTSLEQFDDISSKNQYARALQEGYTAQQAMSFLNRRSRDNTRSPMAWDGSTYAGFSDVKPWLECNEHSSVINVSNEINDPASVLSFYKKLIQFRQEHIDLFVEGDFIALDTEDNVIAYQRKLKDASYTIVCNMQGNETAFSFDSSTCVLSNAEIQKNTLSGWQCILLKG